MGRYLISASRGQSSEKVMPSHWNKAKEKGHALHRRFHGKPDLQRHLVMFRLSSLDMSAGTDHLEPTQVAQGGVGAGKGRFDSGLNAAWR